MGSSVGNVSKTFIFTYKAANLSDTDLSMNIDFGRKWKKLLFFLTDGPMDTFYCTFEELMNLVPQNYFSA